jgi:Tol biopolymer transport system component
MAPVMSQPFSPDARKLVYLVRQGAQPVRLDQRSGALWMADLETGRRVALFPGFEVTSYDLSRDGQRIVFAALDDKDRSHVWLARLDGQLAPHQISSIEADSPRFGTDDDIFFRREEDTHPFLCRMREDGSGIQKAVAESILFFMSVSPDGAWLLARVPPGPHAGSGVVAFSAQDGRAVPVCTDCEADWSPGGEFFVMRSNGRSVVTPVTSAATLPSLPAGGLRIEAGAATFPAGDGFRYPRRDASQYAYMKASIQRNIYRVPLP